MKQFLLFLLVFIPTLIQAQEFYEPSDIDAMWRVWKDKTAYDWVIQNGKKVDVSVNPTHWSSTSHLSFPNEVCLSFLKDNKFLCLTFSKSEGIRMYTQIWVYKLESHYTEIKNLVQQNWFNIDFEHIVYNDVLGWLIIPCGFSYYNNGNNAIAINFATADGINTIQYDPIMEEEEYYNLQGNKVSVDESKGQIIIKTDGRSAKKILNR